LPKHRSLKLRTLYDTIRHLERVVKSYMMTCECEILLYLYENPRSTAGQIFKISNRSSTAFYAKLKEMTEAGILVCSGTSTDRRSRIYDISSAHCESMRMVIEGTLTSTLHEQALENPQEFLGSRILRKTQPHKKEH